MVENLCSGVPVKIKAWIVISKNVNQQSFQLYCHVCKLIALILGILQSSTSFSHVFPNDMNDVAKAKKTRSVKISDWTWLQNTKLSGFGSPLIAFDITSIQAADRSVEKK
jgi:hypothetical protein